MPVKVININKVIREIEERIGDSWRYNNENKFYYEAGLDRAIQIIKDNIKEKIIETKMKMSKESENFYKKI